MLFYLLLCLSFMLYACSEKKEESKSNGSLLNNFQVKYNNEYINATIDKWKANER